MKVFITKFALTKGIFELEVEDCGGGMVKGESWHEYFHREGDQWHKTIESAQAKALEMKDKKIKSLEKQIARVKKLEFV